MAKISKSQIIKLQKTLKTDEAIGKKYGITRQAVHQLRKKYGIAFNRNKYRERNARITALYRKGMIGSELADKLSLSLSQIYRILQKAQNKRR